MERKWFSDEKEYKEYLERCKKQNRVFLTAGIIVLVICVIGIIFTN